MTAIDSAKRLWVCRVDKSYNLSKSILCKYQSLNSYLAVKPWVLVDDLVPVGTLVNGGEPEMIVSYLPSNVMDRFINH